MVNRRAKFSLLQIIPFNKIYNYILGNSSVFSYRHNLNLHEGIILRASLYTFCYKTHYLLRLQVFKDE